jgi:hypothetical protein
LAKLVGVVLVLSGGAAFLIQYRGPLGRGWETVSSFIGRWWPLIATASGVVLVAAGIVRRRRQRVREWEWVARRSDEGEARESQLSNTAMPQYEVRPIPWWLVVVAVAIVVVVGGLTLVLLLYEANKAPAAARSGLRIDAIKTTLLVSGTTSGIQALLLAARRHWASERQQANADARAEAKAREEVALARAADERTQASENRIRTIDRFDKAVEHLSNEKAVIRIAGLHALVELAGGMSIPAQAAIDIVESYLKVPRLSGRQQQIQYGTLPEQGQEHEKHVAERVLAELRILTRWQLVDEYPTDLVDYRDDLAQVSDPSATDPPSWGRPWRASQESEAPAGRGQGSNSDDQRSSPEHNAGPTC